MYNFDSIIPRHNSYSSKWDFIPNHFPNFTITNDVIPLWIADMDFAVSQEIGIALQNVVNHKIYGYSQPHVKLSQKISRWAQSQYKWHFNADNILYTTAAITGLHFIIKTLTKKNDVIVVHQPVYPPLFKIVKNTNRTLAIQQLVVDKNLHYHIDFDALENSFKNAKMFFLCNPQNPTGRVWTKNEIKKIVLLCQKYNVMLISDDVHCDIIYDNNTYNNAHSIAQEICPEFANNIITLISPNKTFNVAGIKISMMVIPDEKQRSKIAEKQQQCIGSYILSPFAIVMAYTAYTKCATWKDALVSYLQNNRNTACEYIKSNFNDVTCTTPESTYLLWINFSKYIKNKKITHLELQKMLCEKAKVALSDGAYFNELCDEHTYLRLNFACPKNTLLQALSQIKHIL